MESNHNNSIEEWDEILELLSSYFSSKYNYKISKHNISDILYILVADEKSIEWPGDLIDANISYTEAFSLLDNFNFDTINHYIVTNPRILPNNLLMAYKAKFKSKGIIWLIHKYDKDPFPSSPHAHQLENNIKLDLGNGRCYKIKKHIYTISRKDLMVIRNEARKVFDGHLPPLAVED
jgi:hypothetical protein